MRTVKSMADLRRVLVSGVATNTIIAAFGQPHIGKVSGGYEQWNYTWPAFLDDGRNDMYVTGVLIVITNGHMMYWDCSYEGVPDSGTKKELELQASGGGSRDSARLDFFVVSTNPVPGGKFIDTERFPKLGYIPPAPALSIRKVKEITMTERARGNLESQRKVTWSFGVFLTAEDSPRLNSITESNISRKILLMIGNEPILAPTVMAPLETGSLAISCDDRPLMEFVKKELARLEKQPADN